MKHTDYSRMVLFLLALICLAANHALATTFPPTLASVDDKRLHSYFCLEAEQTLCLGISTSDSAPVYDPDKLYNLQIKRRDANEAKGTDYLKMRWAADRVNGRIQLSNFTTLCAAKETDNTDLPGAVVLRPCGTQGKLEIFQLTDFLTNVNERGRIRYGADPSLCLSMMTCQRQQLDYCNPGSKTIFSGTTISPTAQRGAWVRFMPCVDETSDSYKSQIWRQTIDCAPGCSPFMMDGDDKNVCDRECDNLECSFDNWACTTPAPTPPTFIPTRSPTTSPTTSRPTRSPSRAPTTSRPSKSPTTSKPTASPTRSPSKSPTRSPTTSKPTLSPTHKPSKSPITTGPSMNPTTSPTRTPSAAPSTSPSKSPSNSPTTRPSASPTVNVTELAGAVPIEDEFPWWLYIIIALLALLLCCCCCFAGFAERRRRRREKEELEKRSVIFKEKDIESGLPASPPPAPKTPPPPKEESPIAVVLAREPSRERVDSNHLVEIPLEPTTPSNKRERSGTVGLLWGGNNEDEFQEMTEERVNMKRQSERIAREQLADKLHHRSFTMPLEEIHEAGGEEGSNGVIVQKSFKRPPSSTALADSAMDYHMPLNEPPSAIHPSDVDGMSIKELKSFIVDNGGDLEGCFEKDQLLARAKELA